MLRRPLALFACGTLLAPPATPPSAAAAAPHATVTILAFSDYHSHALPFYSEGRRDQAGLARAVAYLRAGRAQGDAFVVSGGDMLNKGTPAWSDEFGCVEWPWLDGLVDAMALGNHDLDYGAEAFEKCRASVRFPVLSANLRRADGSPYLLADGKPYLVAQAGGVRIGFFALGGPDVQHLVRPANLPPGTHWTDSSAAAREVVKALREDAKVQAVVFIGHETRAEDEELARAVPGIDLVLGTHSHHKGELRTIPGTRTRSISPYQYLTYVSRVRLEFEGGRLADITGELVRLDASLPEDPQVAERVRALEAELRRRRPERFERVGEALVPMSDAGLTTGESVLGNWAADVLRRAAGAHAFFAAAAGLRAALPPGPLTLEDFLSAFPYPNKLAVAEMTGARLLDLLALSVSRAGSDGFSQQSGLRYAVREGKPVEVRVLKDPADPAQGHEPLDPRRTYRVGTTDFQAGSAAGYQELFAAAGVRATGLEAQAALLEALRAGPIRGALDGRSGSTTEP